MDTDGLSVHATTTGRASRWCAALTIAILVNLGHARADQEGIAQSALAFVNELTAAARTTFFIYKDSDSGFNHSFPSGFFPGGPVLGKIHLDSACVYDPTSANGCTVDSSRFDQVRGTVMRVTFDPLSLGEFVGINFEEPEDYGESLAGVGYDLRGATRVCFDAFSPTPPAANFKVQFGVAQHMTTDFFSVGADWTPICLDLSSLGLTPADLSAVHFLFTVASNDTNAPAGGTLLLDNIRFEPVPVSQATVLSFPLANEVFGVLPAPDVLPGRVRIPSDQLLRNLTTTYESGMAALTLFSAGGRSDANSARQIADAFIAALGHDNQGDPIPAAPDGSTALHNGMSSGDLFLFNDQGPGAGLKGQVRLAGFSSASSLCAPSQFCLVLDGATGGNEAFAMLALLAAYQRLHDQRYLDAARTIGQWIHGNLLDVTGTGYGGYYLGYPDEGQAKHLLTSKSVENNADIFRAFTACADAVRGLGLTVEADDWDARAKVAGDFVMEMFDPIAGRFYAGTVPSPAEASPGITPDGPRMGDDVINTFGFLDAQTFTTLALASSPLYRHAIDWRRPIQWMLDHFALEVTAAGRLFRGFSLVAPQTAGPPGVAWEFTGQAVVAMRFVDALYGESGFEASAQLYLDQIRQAQQWAPFTNQRALVAATLQDGDLLHPYEQCLSTPFQCIAERVGLAATTWAILAEQNINPFLVASRRTRGDLNGDGTSDILWRHVSGGDVWLWPMDGTTRLSENLVRTIADTHWEIRGQGDQTGDGNADLLWRNKVTGEIYFWPMDGATWLEEIYVATVEPAYDIVGTGDFDGDGKSDILWRNTVNGEVWIWLMDGATPVSEVWVDTVDVAYVIKGVGDFDGDLKADIVFHHATTGEVWIWLMDGATRRSEMWVATVPDTGYQIQGVADFTGDGRVDIVWWHVASGEVWIWTMDGTTRLAETWVATVPDTSYRIVGTGDYDGDGKADLLWHHATRGEVWMWLMNGTIRVSETWVATVPDVGYQVVKVK